MADNPPPGEPTRAQCPGRDELIAFNRGGLTRARAEEVGRHLETCPACERLLVTLGDDSDPLIRSLRHDGPTEPYVGGEAYRRLQARAVAIPQGAPPDQGRVPAPPEAGAPELVGPRQLGPYRLLREVRAGGMGVVYEAWHTKLQRRVALKTLHPSATQDRRMIQRFQREMAAVGRLDHPNIVRATDADEIEGCHFLIMDFVEGFDLGEVVRRCGCLSVPDACEVVRQSALALQYAHENGLVHRDVKPSNLMLAGGGEVKLLDLGLALLYDARPAGDELSEAGQRLGTVDYMAPEQARDAHTVDIRADLYSLGCTLYKMLTGDAPFAGPSFRSTSQKMHAHAELPHPPVRERRPDVPSALAAILDRLLAKAPGHRFVEPAELASALEPFLPGRDLPALLERCRSAARPDGPEGAGAAAVAPQTTATKRPRRRAVWAASAVAALVLALAAAGFATLRPPWGGAPSSAPQATAPGEDQTPWPPDYPPSLRARRPGEWVELLRAAEPREGPPDPARGAVSTGTDRRYRPLWCRRLAGTGQYHELPDGLLLSSSFPEPNVGCTALALEDDPVPGWFELEAEVSPSQGLNPEQCFGVFFGWRATAPNRAEAFFVSVDGPPPAGGPGPKGRLLVSRPALPVSDRGPDLGGVSRAALQRAPLAEAPLPPRVKPCLLRVRAAPGKVSVAADDGDPLVLPDPPDPRGALGLWVQGGIATFGKARARTLPAPDHGE